MPEAQRGDARGLGRQEGSGKGDRGDRRRLESVLPVARDRTLDGVDRGRGPTVGRGDQRARRDAEAQRGVSHQVVIRLRLPGGQDGPDALTATECVLLGDRPEGAVAERHVGQRVAGHRGAGGLGDGDVVRGGEDVDGFDVDSRDDGRNLQRPFGVRGMHGDGPRLFGVGQEAIGLAVLEHLGHLCAPRRVQLVGARQLERADPRHAGGERTGQQPVERSDVTDRELVDQPEGVLARPSVGLRLGGNRTGLHGRR